MIRLFLIIICSLFSLCVDAQTSSWPAPDNEMKAEPSPYNSLPAVAPAYGIATLKGKLINGYELPDSVTLTYFMGSEMTIKAKVDSTGCFVFHAPVARTCGAFIDNRYYIFLSPDDTLEVWLSQKSPLLKTERRIFARGPFASLISDIHNVRSQSDVLREHLAMDSSDIMEYMLLEKSVTDMLKTVENCSNVLSPIVMDEILLVSKNPKIVYSRYFPDVLRLVKQYSLHTNNTFSQEVKFYEVSLAIKRGELVNPDMLDHLPLPYKEFITNVLLPRD